MSRGGGRLLEADEEPRRGSSAAGRLGFILFSILDPFPGARKGKVSFGKSGIPAAGRDGELGRRQCVLD